LNFPVDGARPSVPIPLWAPPDAAAPGAALPRPSGLSLTVPCKSPLHRGFAIALLLLIFLSVIAVVGIAAYAIGVTTESGRSTAVQIPHATYSQKPTQPGESVATWWQTVESGVNQIQDDLSTVNTDFSASDGANPYADCEALLNDVSQAESGPAAPNGAVNEPFQSALVNLANGANECETGAPANDQSDLDTAQTDLIIGASDLQQLYVSLSNYLPAGTTP